jgi:hypothetical protein
MVPTLAKGHPSVRKKEEERAQESVPGMVRLEPAQGCKAAPLKTIIDLGKRVRNVNLSLLSQVSQFHPKSVLLNW